MSDKTNPFTPTFGSVPPLFAGRTDVKSDVLRGLEGGLGEPNRISLFVGARGSGKTALLTKIAEDAEQYGWISADVTAIPGMLEDVYERTQEAAAEFVEAQAKSHLTGVTVAGFGATREIVDRSQGNWRSRMNMLLDELNKQSIGLLITVDEANISLDEMRSLVVAFQHFVRERRKVALLMAGLPQNVSALLHDKTISFLRRAVQHQLGVIHEEHEVRETIKKTIELSERTVQKEALKQMTIATGGFPFLIQLVGYHVWRQNSQRNEINLLDADEGIRYALADMESRIFDVTMRELSENDLRFLQAMLRDGGESKMMDIAERLSVNASYASQYRRRLIEQGIIGSRGRGKVGFEIPLFKEYLEKRIDS
ncbi:MAG: ATP-binding protein [Coriobacteriia bacterium]|nr:ATP-binding protein [Coriobacteriia bacterium]MCL2606055.1 ATP-binding protein [Coriobacteriia bacterium]